VKYSFGAAAFTTTARERALGPSKQTKDVSSSACSQEHVISFVASGVTVPEDHKLQCLVCFVAMELRRQQSIMQCGSLNVPPIDTEGAVQDVGWTAGRVKHNHSYGALGHERRRWLRLNIPTWRRARQFPSCTTAANRDKLPSNPAGRGRAIPRRST
jgi:hypothetical protein